MTGTTVREVRARRGGSTRDRAPRAGAGASAPDVPAERSSRPAPGPSRRRTPLSARGEPLVWLTGSGLVAASLMIAGLLALVVVQGARTFWPRPLVEVVLRDGSRILGEVTRRERYRPPAGEIASLPGEVASRIRAAGGWSSRRLLRVGNYDLHGEDFLWVEDHKVVEESRPRDAWLIERREWGPAIGSARAILRDGATIASDTGRIAEELPDLLRGAQADVKRIRRLERRDIGAINHDMEAARLSIRSAAIRHGEGSAEHRRAAEESARQEADLTRRYLAIQQEVSATRADSARLRLVVEAPGGVIVPERPSEPDSPLQLAQIVRAYPANALSAAGRLGIYLDRWREFLTSEPREANTEGGVLPAIFGTFAMTVLMSLAVAPFGVIAALYLREYARQGALVSAVRIAVNNLAGVPSIVFGVFGLGYFCYLVGGSIDQLFFPERLPSPTFGTGGILWASLTLALLTVPVVIVATEEALAAVPRSLREGSFACGASKWQTIHRVVLPRATPGIMTGLILAMARGAGEVAPLMITGVVKLAPDLPVDGRFPYIHLERSFMHLGFHIYDVGFQSRNSEAGKPMVFTTTLLLIALIAALNMAAIALRARLRRRFATAHF